MIQAAQTDKKPKLTSTVSESVPHLKRGTIRDFKDILKEHNYWRDDRWNATDSIYTFETGSQFEFFSADNGDKLRGGRRDRLFLNECNNLTLDAFNQLESRTRDFTFLDWNPSNEFWFYTDVLGQSDDVDHIILTYKDNESLSPAEIRKIERRKNNKNWWQVYGLGQLGELESRIYTGWNLIDEIPKDARLEKYGMDFGYTNDPTAIVAVWYYNNGYILDQITFQKGLSNKQIADILNQQPRALVVADSAEPKSIDEIKSYHVNIVPATKGAGSVLQGIQFVQEQNISVTKRSLDVIKEYRNYVWMTDKLGKIINEPDHLYSHCFAPETLIHTTKGLKRIDELVGKEGYLISKDGRIERFYDVKPTRLNAEVVSLHLENGDTLTVTPDHLLLMPDGVWKEARLLCPQDMIQSVYATHNSQWQNLYKICRNKVLQGIRKWQEVVSTQIHLVFSEWGYTREFSHSSQGWKSRKQQPRQFRVKAQGGTSKRPHDSRSKEVAKGMGGQSSTISEQVAWVRTGQGISQVAWQEKLGRQTTFYERMRSLPYQLRNAYQSFKRQILFSELQDESQTQTIKRISRGFRSVTYNLEVENTHCLLANGIIAHNSMDAIRYAFSQKKRTPGLTWL